MHGGVSDFAIGAVDCQERGVQNGNDHKAASEAKQYGGCASEQPKKQQQKIHGKKSS